MVSRCWPGFGRKERVKPHLCTRLAFTSKRSTRRRHPADDPKGTLPFDQHIKTKIKQEKYRDKDQTRENTVSIRISYNSLQVHTSAGTPGQYRICSVPVPPVYVQHIYLKASVRRYVAGGIYRRYCRFVYIYTHIFKCVPVPVPVPVQTFVPVPDALASSARHQDRYRQLW